MRHTFSNRTGLPATLGLAMVFFASSCLEPDTIAPPPPTIDPVKTPTSLSRQVITGYAEYGATVQVEREPEMGEGILETQADAFSARFAVEVPLSGQTENVFRITAVDAAGNRSSATEVAIVHQLPLGQAVSLVLDPPVFHESVGAFQATARIHHSEAGVDLSGKEIVFERSFTPPGGVPELEVETRSTDRLGEAAVLFVGIGNAGDGFVRAHAEGGTIQAVAPFLVHGDHSGPVSIGLQLEAQVEGETRGPSSTLEVPAGTQVTATVSLRDGSDNLVDRAVVITTDAPGAVIAGDRLNDISRAGSWVVSAMAPGTALVASARLDVTPATPDSVALLLSQRTIPLGLRLPYALRVEDQWGNEVSSWPVTVSTSPETSAVDQAAQMITFQATGEYEVIASAQAGAGSIEDRRLVQVVESQGGLPPQMVRVDYPPAEGMIGTTARRLPVRVSVAADAGISEIRVHTRGPGISFDSWHYTPEAPTSGTFTLPLELPVGAAGDQLTFTAVAVDMNGRITVGEAALVTRVASPIINAGYALRVVQPASGTSLLVEPRGMARSSSDQILVVTKTKRIVEVNIRTGAERDLGIELPGEGWDIEVLPGGHVLVSYASGVARLDSTGNLISTTWLTGNEPRGLHVGDDGDLYLARRDDSRVYVFDPSVVEDRGWADRRHFLTCNGELGEAWGVMHSAVESTTGNRVVYVSRHNNSRVIRCVDDGAGVHISLSRAFDGGILGDPRMLSLLGNQDVLVTGSGNGRIVRGRNPSGTWVRSIAIDGLSFPYGLLKIDTGHFVMTDEVTSLLYELFVEPEGA